MGFCILFTANHARAIVNLDTALHTIFPQGSNVEDSKAGVDMAKPAPYRAVVHKMNAIMDELEALLEQRDN